jgi:large subunit ribosomal protein L35
MAKGLKTKKAAAKRFKLTATGKIKYKRSHMRHILTKKTSNYKRGKRQGAYIDSTHEYVVMRCLPFGA